MAVNDQPRLGCGRLVEDVWAQADQPPDAHERDCPFCQRARASLETVSAVTETLIAHEDQHPDYAPSARVKDFVMQLVHVEVRRGQPIPLLTPEVAGEAADLTISEQAVLDVVWRAADQLTDLRVRRCWVAVHPADQQPGLPAVVHADVSVTVAVGHAIPEAAETLRAHLRARIAAETSLSTRRITITVEDVYDA